MMRFSILFLLAALSVSAFSQNNGENRESFDEGNYFFSRGEYAEAAWYFRNLTISDTGNSHFSFRLGECYMNIPGSEKLAIPYFEKAVKNTVDKKKYREKDFSETNAPLHAWFYLGNVYRIAGRLDEALNAYNVFTNSPLYYGNYNLNVVENEIKSCERAKIIMDSPVDARFTLLDPAINTSASELSPVLSADEQTIIFIRKLKFYDAILSVEKEDSIWGQPVNLNPFIGSDGEYYPVSLSADGNTLYLVRTTEAGKDLYIAYRRSNGWSKAEPLEKINSPADETWVCPSGDGSKLWFTSSRKGGFGGLDIYFAAKDKNGRWTKIKNAGKIINTQFDEESPCLSNNDNVLFFSSKGHYSMGGYDIFYTERENKSWKTPVNLGFPVNNTNDNYGYIPVRNGRAGYYSIFSDEPNASEDIYQIVLNSNYPLH